MGFFLPLNLSLHPMMTGAVMASSSVSVLMSSLRLKQWKRPKESILAEHGDGSFGVLPHHHAASSSFEGFAGGRGLEEYLPGGALETAFSFERGSTSLAMDVTALRVIPRESFYVRVVLVPSPCYCVSTKPSMRPLKIFQGIKSGRTDPGK
ncbi:hypothetical protein BJ322DRAFT_498178 [Thelephora terrestris]|uniref:Uncharacterized protein n=1 Tax=Thelephora terrestris TaxID=56493 RepID=A0A9P6L1H9_9AGAM|nr:hypothetical protein BJ322DRAFT_498178 [Thelephora terrestris]